MILETLLLLLPLGLFLTMAYAAEDTKPLAWVVYATLVLGDILFLLIGAPFSALLFLDAPVEMAQSDIDPALLAPIGPIFLLLGLLGLMMLYPPFRAPIAAVTRIDPDRIVHVVALHYALLLVAAASTIAVSVSVALADPTGLEALGEVIEQGGLSAVWVQALALVAVGFLGVGLFVRRSWSETLDRLGLERGINVRLALLVPIIGLMSGYIVDQLWMALSPETLEDVGRIGESLFQPYIERGIAGALTIGLAAGIGEEILFRGAAQPRLGLALTAFLFAVLHTQYTVSPALLQVLVLGLLLGVARERSNTTTAIAGHALYNFILVMIAIYAPEVSP